VDPREHGRATIEASADIGDGDNDTLDRPPGARRARHLGSPDGRVA
jgi:hypothetical protein